MSGPDFLREVEESIRAEKAAKFWKDNGNTILTIIAAIIIGTAAQAAWMGYKNSQNEASTSQFYDALKKESAIDSLQQLAKQNNGTGSALAGLNAASLAVDKRDWLTAISLYKAVAENSSSAKIYKDIALLQMVTLQMDHDQTATGETLLKSLSPLIEDKTSPWNTRAIFTSALVKAHKNNDVKAALADLESLKSSPNLAPTLEEQASALMEVYKIKLGSQ